MIRNYLDLRRNFKISTIKNTFKNTPKFSTRTSSTRIHLIKRKHYYLSKNKITIRHK